MSRIVLAVLFAISVTSAAQAQSLLPAPTAQSSGNSAQIQESFLPDNQSVEKNSAEPAEKTFKFNEEADESLDVYRNTGVSQRRIEIAQQKSQMRRMRMEMQKWKGHDSVRPAVAPLGNVPIYSSYYNGVFTEQSLFHYRPTNHFYFSVPFTR